MASVSDSDSWAGNDTTPSVILSQCRLGRDIYGGLVDPDRCHGECIACADPFTPLAGLTEAQFQNPGIPGPPT